MPRPTSRTAVAVAIVLLLPLLAACSAAGGEPSPAAGADPSAPPAGQRTVVRTELPGGAMVVEVVRRGADVAARSWGEAADGSLDGRELLLEELRIGTDHWVQLPALVHEGILEPGWIHIDLSEADERAWYEANALGLLEQEALWSAGPGDDTPSGAVVAVEERSSTERVLELAGGGELRVTREALAEAPSIAPPEDLPVVPLRDVAQLLAR